MDAIKKVIDILALYAKACDGCVDADEQEQATHKVANLIAAVMRGDGAKEYVHLPVSKLDADAFARLRKEALYNAIRSASCSPLVSADNLGKLFDMVDREVWE